jgi:hypothetical protein
MTELVAQPERYVRWYPFGQLSSEESGVCTKSGGGTDAVGVFAAVVVAGLVAGAVVGAC